MLKGLMANSDNAELSIMQKRMSEHLLFIYMHVHNNACGSGKKCHLNIKLCLA